MKRVTIEQAEVISPFGDLQETVSDLIDGVSSIVPGPIFNISVAHAPFCDTRYRHLPNAVSRLSSKIKLEDIDPTSTIFLYCAAKGDISAIEQYVLDKNLTSNIAPLLDRQIPIIHNLLSFKPARSMVISNACASGAIGIEIASELLRTEQYETAIVFGFDALSKFTTSGFYSLGALSEHACKPFDANRTGLTMGEGAAIAVLSYRKTFDGDCVIMGAGSSNDANHRTGPSRTGDGLYKAAHAAIIDASISPNSIGAVKCHGTATPFNDAMEAKALHLIFGNNYPPCVSLKGAVGHLSGAGSLIEILLSAEFINRGKLPPTIGFLDHGVDEPIAISSSAQKIEQPVMLCLSAGFGGLNSAVVIGEVQE